MEPYADLETAAMLAAWGRAEEIAYNQTRRQAAKWNFYRDAFDFLTDNRIKGGYLEFGCHRVRTFRMALTEARKHNANMEFWAFDSFAGLPDCPEQNVEIWSKGALATSEAEFWAIIHAHGLYLERVHTVPGFYADSLTPEIADNIGPAALITIDCDLYESAVPVLAFVEPLLQEGTVVYVDDWFAGYKGNPGRGVARAFREHEPRSRWRFQPFVPVGWWGRAFIAYR